jgi:hypothetical protein
VAPQRHDALSRWHIVTAAAVCCCCFLLLLLLCAAAAAAVAALNDALQALGMKLTFEPPVSAGRWIVTDAEGRQHQFKVG